MILRFENIIRRFFMLKQCLIILIIAFLRVAGQDAKPGLGKIVPGSTTPTAGGAIPAPSNATYNQGALSKGDVTPSSGYLGFSQDLFNLTAGSGFNVQIGIDYSNAGVYQQV